MERTQDNILDAIYEDDGFDLETLDDGDEDIEMVDVDAGGGGGGGEEVSESAGGSLQGNPNRGASKKKKKNKKKRRRTNSGSTPNITNINRFVLDTCRRLKEKKSYLVWNAIGCLGVSAFSDLVKEVDAIQSCGGQKTIDGSRFRTGGGILWNILKTREPNAYKEIMAKGREFEKQLWEPKKKHNPNENEAAVSQNISASDEAAGGEVLDSSERMPEVLPAPEPLDSMIARTSVKEVLPAPEPLDSMIARTSVKDRMRVPVSYDDLFEEGEIPE